MTERARAAIRVTGWLQLIYYYKVLEGIRRIKNEYRAYWDLTVGELLRITRLVKDVRITKAITTVRECPAPGERR